MYEWGDTPTFTDNLRRSLWEAGWRKGKRLTFYYRTDNNKRKKVTGHFQYLCHTPGKGFLIRMDHVHWLGNYWGPVTLGFSTRRIEWDKYAEQVFAEVWEMARQRVPKLESGQF